MEPFIAKFVARPKITKEGYHQQYSAENEMMACDVAGLQMIIEDPIIVSKTGSYLTDSYGDPTRDESTDR